MSTATTIAITSAANAQAAAANAQAAAAKRAACMGYVKGYTHDQATVAEMRQYANCIDNLYPSDFDYTTLKVIVLVLLIGVLIGTAWGYSKADPKDRAFDAAMGGFAGFLGGCCVLLGVGAGWFLLS